MMLSTEQKRLLFIKLRQENYIASLRLEGFQVSPVSKKPASNLAELKAKHGR